MVCSSGEEEGGATETRILEDQGHTALRSHGLGDGEISEWPCQKANGLA